MTPAIRKTLAQLLVAVLACVIVMLASSAPIYDFIERKTLDYRFTVRDAGKKAPPDSPVIIVGIDKKTMTVYSDPIALNESLMEAIGIISGGGAKVIGYDVVHISSIDPERCSYRGVSFLETIAGSSNLVAPYTLAGDDVGMPAYVAELMMQIMGLSRAEIDGFPQAAKLKLLDAAGGMLPLSFGYANLAPDRDGVSREINLTNGFGDSLLPSFSLAIYMKYAGIDAGALAETADGLHIGDRVVPQRDSKMLINYAAPPGGYPGVPLADVIEKKSDEKFLREKFDGKIALIGAYDLKIPDYHPTPYYGAGVGTTRNMFGVEINANALDTIIRERYIARAPEAATVAIVFAACLVSVFLLTRVPLWWSVPMLAALMSGWVAVCRLAFSRHDLWLDLVSVTAALPLAFLLGHLSNTFVLDRDKRFIQRLLGSYLDPRIVKELSQSGDMSLLKGRRREITVLFSDIRGFTTLSEKLEPEQVVEILNVHLSALSDAIISAGGMVDKYVGDAIMAVWNAPNDVEDHRLLACETAIRMRNTLAETNRRLAEKGIKIGGELKIGIGINTGHAVVGNIGSELKSDYTAIGDAVNVASRLESLNKQFGTTIIISGSTLEGIEERLEVRDLGAVPVKGRGEPVRVFELIGVNAAI